MRRLTISISAGMAGRKVKSILRRELGMAEGHIARVKLRPEGIVLNGTRCLTVDTVREGDILTVQVGDHAADTSISPAAVHWISLQSKGLSRVFFNTTVQKHQFFGTQVSLSNSHIHT